MTDITEIVVYVLGLITTFVVTFVLPTIKKWINAKINVEQQKQIDCLIKTAVYAAEQTIKANGDGKVGAQKKEFVMKFLEDRNLTIDEEVLDAKVEACVAELNGVWGY